MIEALLGEYLAESMREEMADIYTAMPGVVTNVVNMGDCRVDVQPSINIVYGDDSADSHTQILGVPIIFPASSTSCLSFPIKVGDPVLLVFAQRSMDNFKIGNGQPTTPSDFRRFNIQDAVAIPGLFPFSRSANKPSIRKFPHNPNSDMVLAHNVGSGTEVMIQLKLNGDVVINTEADVTVNAENAVVNATGVNVTAATGSFAIGNSTWNGSMDITGTWTFNGIPFNTHKHVGVTPGSGTSGVPTA